MAETGHTSLKVPRDNNRYLCIPTACNATQLLSENAVHQSSTNLPEWLVSLRMLARNQSIETAVRYTGQYTSHRIDRPITGQPIAEKLIVGGHQPELFHPGVWFKNFLLWEIAQSNKATSLHVIVDHDLARSDSLRVPYVTNTKPSTEGTSSTPHKPAVTISGATDALRAENVRLPFRRTGSPLPWHLTHFDGEIQNNGSAQSHSESTKIDDWTDDTIQNWSEVAQHIETMLRSCGIHQPMASKAFPKIASNIRNGLDLSQSISRVRHQIELDHGVSNLEVPMSLLCEQSAFAIFVHHLFSHAKQFATIYNRCRSEYRAARKIHNPTQPVLELETNGDWLELPFWLYSETHPARKRLWFCERDGLFEIRQHPPQDPNAIRITLPTDREAFVDRWLELMSESIAIRPRALMTTMYLRCVVSDLFVHGIGGGIYDELTDAIIREFLQIEPPHFVICSASLHLPISGTSHTNREELIEKTDQAGHQLQLLRSRPERFLAPMNAESQQLLAQHAALLSAIPERGHKKAWHDQITSVKRQLTDLVRDQRQAIEELHRDLASRFQQTAIANSREYSFVLFEHDDLVRRLRSMAQEAINAGN